MNGRGGASVSGIRNPYPDLNKAGTCILVGLLKTGKIGLGCLRITYVDPVNSEVGDMSMIDKQRIGAVRMMEGLGYSFDGVSWNAPMIGWLAGSVTDDADAMHALLVLRADKLAGCVEGSEEEAELKKIAETIEAYETKRWPDGVVPRGKG
jgi:hypothetical protein